MRWPLPALAAWSAGWLLWHLTAPPWDWAISAVPVLACMWLVRGPTRRMRQLVLALGWLLSLWLLVGMERLAVGWWFAALTVLLLAYPLSAWKDAPVFPTPLDALDALTSKVKLPDGAPVLDAGCGTGAGLQALRRAFPTANHQGIERSLLWAAWARMRCPWAVIFHGDIWQQSWAPFSLVYLFQRPESMQRAWEKASQEMRPGSWLASLEFRIEGQRPHASWPLNGGRQLWLYRIKPSSVGRSPPINRGTR